MQDFARMLEAEIPRLRRYAHAPCRVGTVRSRLSRGRERLRELIGHEAVRPATGYREDRVSETAATLV